MPTRRYPPAPKAPPSVEKFTVWTVYADAWFGVRNFELVEEAREFAKEVIRGPVLITGDRVTHEITLREQA